MTSINPTLSVIIFNISGLNIPIKRQILAKQIEKMIQLYGVSKTYTLDPKTQIG